MTAQQAQAAARMLRDIVKFNKDSEPDKPHLYEWQLVSLEELAELLEETTNANRS